MKLETTRQRNLTRAAVAQFERGTISAEALTAALIALGLDPTLVASVLSVETAKQAGKLKFVYGQFLTPENAKVLSENVAAYEAQYKANLIDTPTVTNALAVLKVPTDQATALIADWAAAKPVTPTVAGKLPV